MEQNHKTVIVTGASQGIGAGIAHAFLARGYDVVATARNATKSKDLSASDHLALVDGNIGQFGVATKVAEIATSRFGSIDALVNNAGIFSRSPLRITRSTIYGLWFLSNIEGFFFITQLAIKQMLAQKTGGSIVNMTRRWWIIRSPGPTSYRSDDHQGRP